MPIVPRHPWNMEKFFEEWEMNRFPRLPGRFWREVPMIRQPRMDIYETDKNVVAEVELPGVDPKNIEVQVQDNMLSIAAERQEEKEEKGKGYFRQELSRGVFTRAVPLPAEVMEEKTEAVYEGGVLKVTMPKQKIQKAKKKGIKVKVKTA